MRICICFYGLVQRSLKKTIENIKHNILQDGHEYDIFIHTFNTTHINSSRNNEYNIPINVNDIFILNPDKYLIDDEKEFNFNFNFSKIEKYGDEFRNNFQSLHNAIREMKSIQRVYSLIEKDEYDFIIMSRADLAFDKKFNFNFIKKHINDDTVFTKKPVGPHIFNHSDFFIVGTKKSLCHWANRIDAMELYCQTTKMRWHPETHVTFGFLTNNIKNIFLDIDCKPVRT